MKPEFSESTITEVAEGDAIIVLKFRGKSYAKAFRFDDPKAGAKMKAAMEATQRILNV